jgi:hypothetical protein
MAEVHALGHPDSPPPRTRWPGQPGPGAAAPSQPSTVSAAPTPFRPNQPDPPTLGQGTNNDLIVLWTAPGVDTAHSTATTFSLRYSPSGTGTWTTVGTVSSPYALTGLTAGTAHDVQVRAANSGGTSNWSATATLSTVSAGPYAPNAPAVPNIAPPADGTVTELTVTWAAPAVDGTHGAATGYNIRTSPHRANTWSVMNGVTSPCTLGGLSGATAVDIQVQATNAATSPSPWSATGMGRTWGAKVTPGGWQPATSQVHGASVAPNGGAQLIAIASPTAVTGAAFAWSTSATTVPTAGLIIATADGQQNGWGQSFNAPATAGTYYLWSLARGAGGITIGALVSGAITVS